MRVKNVTCHLKVIRLKKKDKSPKGGYYRVEITPLLGSWVRYIAITKSLAHLIVQSGVPYEGDSF